MANTSDLRKRVQTFPWEDWQDRLRKQFEPLYRDGVSLGARVNVGALDIEDPYVSRFMTDYVGERIVSLTDTTREEIIELVRRELEAGHKTPGELGNKIFDALTKKFDGYKKYRADRIARTETAIAMNHGTVLAAEQAGFDEVDVTDGDDDDAACREANGAVWPTERALREPVAHPHCRRAFAPHVATK